VSHLAVCKLPISPLKFLRRISGAWPYRVHVAVVHLFFFLICHFLLFFGQLPLALLSSLFIITCSRKIFFSEVLLIFSKKAGPVLDFWDFWMNLARSKRARQRFRSTRWLDKQRHLRRARMALSTSTKSTEFFRQLILFIPVVLELLTRFRMRPISWSRYFEKRN